MLLLVLLLRTQCRLRYVFSSRQGPLNDGRRFPRYQAILHGLEGDDGAVNV